jgi:putative membrane protein
MKLTGFGAIACAALMAVACGGDARDERGNDADRTVGTSGVADDDSAVNDRDDGLDDRAATDARIGDATDEYQARTGATATSGAQAHGASGDDRHFVETAAMGGHAEVELGKLAAERAQSQDVKQFAQMMITDHTKANDELKQAASRQHVDVPAPKLDQKHQQLMTKLRGLRGAEFDREYMRAMVDGHKEMKSLLEDRADRGGNTTARTDNRSGATGTSGSSTAAVNQWASKTLPSVEKHLQRAEQINATLER